MLKRSLVCVVAAAALMLGACGNSEAFSLTKPAGLLAAVDNTTKSKTSKVDLNLSMDLKVGNQSQHIAMTGTGAIDYQNNKGQLTLSVPASDLVPAMNVEEIVDGTIAYVKVTDGNGKSVSSKPWTKVDLADRAGQTGFDGLGAQQSNPAQYLDMLRGGADNMTKVGTETLRGTKTTHYTMQVDFAKAAQASSGDQKKSFEKLAEIYKKPVPVEVWVDGKGVLRKLVITLDMSSLGDSFAQLGLSGTTRVEEELYDFGTPVNVEAPPADQVLAV
jgi:hypothetical protein